MQRTRNGAAANRANVWSAHGSSLSLPEWSHPWLLIAVSLLVFAGALSAGFAFDDQTIVLQNPDIRDFRFGTLFDHWGRPVRTLTLMMDWALFGDSPAGYHVHSLLWHGLCVLLLYWLFRRLSGRPTLSFAAALLFAIHPIHVEAVVNIANRKELLCMAFSLAAALAYLRALEASGRKKIGWLAVSGAVWLVALFSKQVAIVMPLCLVLYEWLFVPAEQRLLLRHPRLVLAAGGVGGLVLTLLVVHFYELGDPRHANTVSGYEGEATVATIVLTSARAFWMHVANLVWPARLCPDHEVALSSSLWEPMALAAWAAFAGWIAIGVAAAWRHRVLCFGLLWVVIHWLPVSNLIPATYVLADRYMYIPSAGFCLAAVYGVSWLRTRLAVHHPAVAPALLAVGAVLVLGWTWRTVAYTQHWQSENSVWEYALTCNPESYRAHYYLGFELTKQGRYEPALPHFEAAVGFEPGWEAAHYAWANALHATGRLRDAVRVYDLAIARWPGHAGAWYNRGVTHAALGDWERAIADYDRAIESNPELSEAYANRGIARMRLGRSDAAQIDYQTAITLKPENGAAHFNLALLYERRGELRAAFESYANAASLGVAEARQALQSLSTTQVTSQNGERP